MKLETKFNAGDTVFYIHDAHVVETIVRGFKIERLDGVTTVTYLCNDDATAKVHLKVNEDKAYPTKQELLNSL